MASNSATASLALFDCSGPIRCNVRRAGDRSASSGGFCFRLLARFSPNTRCPASTSTGSMASASKVFDTASSVTEDAVTARVYRHARESRLHGGQPAMVESDVKLALSLIDVGLPFKLGIIQILANSAKRSFKPY